MRHNRENQRRLLCAISAFERVLMYRIQETRDMAENPHDAVVKLDTNTKFTVASRDSPTIVRLLFSPTVRHLYYHLIQ